MDVVIAGAGSIGLLIGSFLSEAGMDVTFYVRREEQAELIRGEGIQRKCTECDNEDFVIFRTWVQKE